MQTQDKTKRQKTRHRGISYREGVDGRTYSVFFQNHYIARDAAGNLLTTERAALTRQAELRGSKSKGEKPVIASRTLFSELAEEWYASKSRHLRDRTATYYRNALDLVLIPRFGMRRIASISADDVAQLVRDLESEGLHAVDAQRPARPLGRSSIENYLKPLQGVLALAVRRRMIGMNPFDLLTSDDRPKREAKREAHEWTPEDVAALLEASRKLAAKKEARQSYTLLLQLAATLGLRLGEILGLQWQDLDTSENLLHVRRQWLRSGEYGPTKTPAGVRTIPVPNGDTGLRQALLEWKLASPFKGDDDPIFAARSGRPLGHRNATRRGFEAARDEAGLPSDLTFHDLRHMAASRLIDAGLDVVTIAELLGHGDPNITLRTYAHRFNRQRSDDAVRRALES